MDGEVVYEFYEAGYGVIRLQRPEKRNAINERMIERFKLSLEQAKQDEQKIKFLVITGSGDQVFSAGGDLNYLHEDLTTTKSFSRLYPMKEILFDIVSFPVPTICLLNGGALGGGCEIATACDFRIAKESTKFGFIQSTLGIIPGWGGGVLLYEKVHSSFAYTWLMNGEVYDSSYLLDRGWIHKVIPKEDWSNEKNLLQPYIEKSYDQMKILKNQYKSSLSVLALSAQMNEEVRNCSNLWGTTEHKQAVHQFITDK